MNEFTPMNKRPHLCHVVIEAWTANESQTTAIDIFYALIERLSLTVLNETTYVFPNDAKTIVCVLSESHISLHCWPELGYFHVDLLTCTPEIDVKKVEQAVEYVLLRNENQTKYLLQEIKY